MENYFLAEALEIVKAQASVRNMTEEEIISMVQTVAKGLQGIDKEGMPGDNGDEPAIDPKKAIKEKSIVCVECGKSFKIITKRHLSAHDLTPEEYKEKWGYKKNQPLTCKALARERRQKMKEMRLWERRGKNKKS